MMEPKKRENRMPTNPLPTQAFLCIFVAGLFSSPLHAHPGGSTVSMGTNPVRSFSGSLNLSVSSTAASVFTVPESQDLIVTDVVSGLVANTHYCMGTGRLILKSSTDTHLAEFPLYFSHLEDAGAPKTTVLQATSGIRVPAGTTINVEWVWSYRECSDSNYRVPYLFTGYLAQP